MKALTIKQLNSHNVDFESFYKTLQLYGEIINVIEIDVVTHCKFFLYRKNYFWTKQYRGQVVAIGSLYKNLPDYSELKYNLKQQS